MDIFQFLSKGQWIEQLTWWQGAIILFGTLFITVLWDQVKKIKLIDNFLKGLFKKKRSCGDCILLLFGEMTKYRTEREMISKKVLENQMNYAEQKIESIILDLLSSYKEDQRNLRKGNIDSINEQKEYAIYRESLSNAMELVKRELRMSCKSNGFEDKENFEFSNFVKNKCKILIDLGRKYLFNSYPSEGMTVTLHHRFESMNIDKIEDVVFDFYINAKQLKRESNIKIKELDENFKKNIDLLANKR